MVAHYENYNGMFEVDLWEEGKGFILDLTHEYNYELDPRVPGTRGIASPTFAT
jgi:hypothetical protein